MKSNVFGLDIGTTAIKVAWLNRNNSTISYISSLLLATPVQGMQSESPFDQQEMAQVINKLVIDAKITTNNVNISLPESHAFTKIIEMPVISDRELANAIYWEAEQYIPMPLESVTLAWSKLRDFKNSLSEDKMQVLLVAAPKDLIKRYQAILDLAGLTIVSIETEILAVIRGLSPNQKSLTSLIVNIGATSTTLGIVQNGFLVFNYSVPLGGNALTRAIASDFGLQPSQAEEYKCVYGLSDKNFGGKIRKAIEPVLAALMTEVKKAVTYYTEKYKNEFPISQLLLTGGGASLPGLTVYFAQNLGIEAVLANPWKILNVQGVPQEVESKGPAYSVAVGLALKDYE
ncbi:MAG TPA: type IV pilus assembly protein PilM [Candidatus Sulfotelmatobacter sp.]|jgi:type IV pilus assembly protein PilM|nr:type IV pilus assembly protein PilM [Candidatus Sulfotelmatobacter sp.]